MEFRSAYSHSELVIKDNFLKKNLFKPLFAHPILGEEWAGGGRWREKGEMRGIDENIQIYIAQVIRNEMTPMSFKIIVWSSAFYRRH